MEDTSYPYLMKYVCNTMSERLVELELDSEGYEISVNGEPFTGMPVIVLGPDEENDGWFIVLVGGRKYFVAEACLFPIEE